MFWFQQGLCSLPAFLVVWSSSTFIVSYLVAVFRHDVDVIFPYISETGANPPESCIFGLMTFITSCAGIATIYARYKFVEKLGENSPMATPRVNKAALWLGMLSCLSMCVVATFQQTAVTEVHDLGALLFFLCGVLYIILQSYISRHVSPAGSSAALHRARVAISTLAALAFVPTVICAFFVKQTSMHRNKDDQDYPFHLASAVCEWIAAFSFVCYFLTYIHEFKLFTLEVRTEFERFPPY